MVKVTKKNGYIVYLFVLPAIILLLLFLIYPAIQSFIKSASEWDGISKPVYIGFDNFKDIFNEKGFWLAVKNTFILLPIAVIGTVVLGFLLAVAIERQVKGWKFFKVAWFIPVMMSPTVVSMLWLRIFDPTYGPLNQILRYLGLGILAQDWLSNPKIAIYSIGMVIVWQYTGFTMLLLLTAMENIPIEIHDSATLDGINLLGRIRYIIFPMIRPAFMIVVLLQIISTLKVFDVVWVLTQGGPGQASTVLGVYLYQTAFTFQRFGYGSAVAVILFVVLLIIGLIYLNVTRQKEIYV